MGAIERGGPVVSIGCIVVGVIGCVEERVDLDHTLAHVGGLFEDLRSNVSKEGVGCPASENHDAVCVCIR